MSASAATLQLTTIYKRPNHYLLLWLLLGERDESVNISHKEMPSWDDHVAFVDGRPYEAWYFIEADGEVVGTCYLTKANEIGVQIFAAQQGNGLGQKAIAMLVEAHGHRRYLANINPSNDKSARLFQRAGFRLVQHTYALST